MMDRNNSAPLLEKLDKEEFIIDFENRDRLIAESDARINAVKKEIEEENMKQRIIRNRLKVLFPTNR